MNELDTIYENKVNNNWAYCVSRYMKEHNLELDEHLFFLIGAGLYLGLCFPFIPGSESRNLSDCYLVSTNPLCNEFAAASLNAPILIIRRRNSWQVPWMQKELEKNFSFLIKISEKPFLKNKYTEKSFSGKPVYAFVERSGPDMDHNSIYLEVAKDIKIPLAPSELLDCWLVENDYTFNTEILFYYPPRKIKSDEGGRELVKLLLVKQYFLLKSEFKDHICGIEALRFLKNHLVVGKDKEDVESLTALHRNLLSSSFYNDILINFSDLNRMYFANCLDYIEEKYKIGFNKTASAYREASSAWQSVFKKCKLRLTLSELNDIYDFLIEKEYSALECYAESIESVIRV